MSKKRWKSSLKNAERERRRKWYAEQGIRDDLRAMTAAAALETAEFDYRAAANAHPEGDECK